MIGKKNGRACRLEKPEAYLYSSTSKPMPKWMLVFAVVLGIFALATAYRIYAAEGLVGRVVYNLVVAVICLCGAGISKRLYLADVGVVRETHSWGRVIRNVLDWDDIRHVSIARRTKNIMVFFEVDFTGWKVMFARDQEAEVLDILGDMIPDVEVEFLGPGDEPAKKRTSAKPAK